MQRAGSPGPLPAVGQRRSTCCPARGWSRRRPRRAWCWRCPAAAKDSAASAASWSPRAPASPTPSKPTVFSAEELRAGWRLACQIDGRRADGGRGAAGVAGGRRAPDSRRTRPRRATARPTIRRCRKALRRTAAAGPRRRRARRGAAGEGRSGRLEVDLALLRELPGRLRAVRVPRHGRDRADGRLLDFEPGNTEAEAFAVAAGHRHHHPGGRRCWTWAPAGRWPSPRG